MKTLHVKTGDTVIIRSGKDGPTRGSDKKDPSSGTAEYSRGKVLEVSPKEGKVIVEGLNKIKKHMKPRRMGEQGGIIEAEAAMYAAKVQLICPKCGKPTRVGHAFVGEGENKKKMRLCKKCGATFQ